MKTRILAALLAAALPLALTSCYSTGLPYGHVHNHGGHGGGHQHHDGGH